MDLPKQRIRSGGPRLLSVSPRRKLAGDSMVATDQIRSPEVDVVRPRGNAGCSYGLFGAALGRAGLAESIEN